MTNAGELIKNALQELAEEEKDPKNMAIKGIIRVERNYYYSARGSYGRLREIRDIVNKYAVEKGNEDAD